MSGAAYRMVAAIEALAAADAALEREPTDDDIYNRPGVEGGIGYAPDDQPGSLGENDFRL